MAASKTEMVVVVHGETVRGGRFAPERDAFPYRKCVALVNIRRQYAEAHPARAALAPEITGYWILTRQRYSELVLQEPSFELVQAAKAFQIGVGPADLDRSRADRLARELGLVRPDSEPARPRRQAPKSRSTGRPAAARAVEALADRIERTRRHAE